MQDSQLVERIAEMISGRADARMVYGDPIARDGVTIVPVARIRFGFGGGGGRKPAGEDIASQQGQGGGGGLVATPAGFLIVRDGDVRYRPIRDTKRLAALVLALGVGVVFTLRGVARLIR